MTDEDIARIRWRAAAATPGPWHADGADVVHEDGSMLFEGESGRLIHTAEFIAHARQDIPALLAEVERLRGWRDVAEEHLSNQLALERENAALREVAQEVAFASTIAPSETRSYLVLHNPDKADALLAKARALLNPKAQPDL